MTNPKTNNEIKVPSDSMVSFKSKVLINCKIQSNYKTSIDGKVIIHCNVPIDNKVPTCESPNQLIDCFRTKECNSINCQVLVEKE